MTTSWSRLPFYEDVAMCLQRARLLNQIAVIWGPTQSGKRTICKEAWEHSYAASAHEQLLEFNCRHYLPKRLCAIVESAVLSRSNVHELFGNIPKPSGICWIALHDAQALKRDGLEEICRIHAQTTNVRVVMTMTRDPMRIWLGGDYRPADFTNFVAVTDWSRETIAELLSSWGQPWSDFIQRAEAGEQSAIQSLDIILKASSGRTGQLAVFRRSWERSYVRSLGIKDADFDTFSPSAVRTLASLLSPLTAAMHPKKTDFRRNTDHAYLPSLIEVQALS